MHEQANEQTPWWDDDAFWDAFGPMMFTAERWAGTPAEVDGIVALAQPAAGARVLDLACGPGRHVLELARRGYRVTGVDRSARFLADALARARAEDLSVDLQRSDMRAFRPDAGFDLALSLFTSFGYFEDPDDDRRVLANLRRALVPGGVLVIDVLGTEVLARRFTPRDWHTLPDGSLKLEERRVDGWTRMDNRWSHVRDGNVRTFRVRHQIYSGGQLRMLLHDAGFPRVDLYGGLDGSPYDHAAKRLVAVART